MNTRKSAFGALFLLLAFVSATASARDDHDAIKAMTYNQYPGADLAPLLIAGTPEAFNDALVLVLQKIAASRFQDRVQQQAEQIADAEPDVVALQEAWKFECQDLLPLTMEGQGCSDPSIAGAFRDQLEDTLTALRRHGQKYRAIAAVKDLDVSVLQVPGFPQGIPFTINGVPALLNTIDRDVLLVRRGVKAKPVDFSAACPGRASLDGCNYLVVANAPVPIGSLAIQRGYVGADIRVGHRNARVITTHLELRLPDPTNPASPVLQAAQAQELIATLQATTPAGTPLILLGDMNSSPADPAVTLPPPINTVVPPYQQFLAAGYSDAWLQRKSPSDGFTCCQLEDLSNRKSQLYERIDLIFSQPEPERTRHVALLGASKRDKTRGPEPRLWPSDHAALKAELRF